MNQADPDVQHPVFLRVDVPRQALEVLRDGEVVRSYAISTSKFGLGTEPGSSRTPLGRFAVGEKIGEDSPLGTIFKSRLPVGIAEQGGDEDLVLSRILWLSGLDPDNANTRDRYIYIHGTNQEHLLGSPASHGCVRMANGDIADLYALVPEGTVVEIVA